MTTLPGRFASTASCTSADHPAHPFPGAEKLARRARKTSKAPKMKLLRHNPAFPDIVGLHATELAKLTGSQPSDERDHDDVAASQLRDALLIAIAKREVAATRVW